jgi:hypothetical protein
VAIDRAIKADEDDHSTSDASSEEREATLTSPSGESSRSAPSSRPKRRRRFHLSLRTMMILVLILGAWLGWFVRSVRIQQNAVAAILKAGGTVGYDLEWRNGGPNPYRKSWVPEWLGGDQAWMPQWMTRGAGLDYFGHVVSVSLVPSRVNDPNIANDATLALVGQLRRVQALWLNSTAITDAGLAHLNGLTELRDLQISYTKIGDAGLANIKGLVSLTELAVTNTQVTDAGIAHLRGMTNLRLLFVAKTRVTDEGVLALEAALPTLYVYREEEMALSGAQPRALKDLDYARSQPVRLASMLLSHRAEAMASRGQAAELLATIDALCGLEAHDKVGLLKIAIACAACVRSIDRFQGQNPLSMDRQALKDRCIHRGIAALATAKKLGLDITLYENVPAFQPPHRFNVHAGELDPLTRHPEFTELIEKNSKTDAER